jgi:thiopurine S-methyltransferase
LTIYFSGKEMKAEYWLQRWREGRTGWHHESVMPLLEQRWETLGVARGTRVLVPLCGKSLDMLWLAQQGMRVLGIEISPLAVEAFLDENRLHASRTEAADGVHYRITNALGAGEIELINGDVFGIASGMFEECHAFYDRAALIAFPAPMRDRLAREVYAKLPAGARGLWITRRTKWKAHPSASMKPKCTGCSTRNGTSGKWNAVTSWRRNHRSRKTA